MKKLNTHNTTSSKSAPATKQRGFRPKGSLVYASLFIWTFLTTTATAQTSTHSSPLENTSILQTLEKQKDMDILKVNLDSFKRSNWSEQELANAALISDFIQHLMNDHDFDYVRKTFGKNPYVQHNRNITDGMEALISYVEGFAKRYPEYTYDVKHIYVDGNVVIFHSHATTKKKHRGNDKKGLNIIDTWKVEDGKIADHWDAVQPLNGFMRFFAMMTGGKIRNSNGVF